MLLLCKSVSHHQSTHQRFSGEDSVAYTVRVYIHPQGVFGKKVMVELERTSHDSEGCYYTTNQTTFHASIAEALQDLAFDPHINNRVYNYLLDDVSELR